MQSGSTMSSFRKRKHKIKTAICFYTQLFQCRLRRVGSKKCERAFRRPSGNERGLVVPVLYGHRVVRSVPLRRFSRSPQVIPHSIKCRFLCVAQNSNFDSPSPQPRRRATRVPQRIPLRTDSNRQAEKRVFGEHFPSGAFLLSRRPCAEAAAAAFVRRGVSRRPAAALSAVFAC